ncbi:hypothetical protein BDR26DRAFT_849186, partial [Obelidium mucronatum]
MFGIVYILNAAILLLVIPLATFPLWRNDLNPARLTDRRHNSSVVATAKISHLLYSFCSFAQLPPTSYGAVHPELRHTAASYIAYDVPWIFRWFGATMLLEVGLSILPFEPAQKQRALHARLYVLIIYLVCHVIGLTGHLQVIYKLWSHKAGGSGGRTLGSTSSSSSSSVGNSGSGYSSIHSTARSRLVNRAPGPNLFGMGELRTNEENEAVRRELEKKAPNTGLDAMLGMGLKHGASGVVGGVDKFYGKGNTLGGSTSSSGSSSSSFGRPVRGSYEKID